MSSSLFRIDRFTVPQEVQPVLLAKIPEIHEKLRTLPGFVRDHVLESQGASEQRQLMTIVEWKNQDSAAAAHDAMQQFHAERGFNAAEFCAQHGISPEFGVFREAAEVSGKV